MNHGESATSSAPRVILASQSPRRRELLDLMGIRHEVRPANVDETPLAGELPAAYVERVARAKAKELAAAFSDAVVIAADTSVVIDDLILGKPIDAADALRMLGRLAGRVHSVFTAVAVARAGRTVSAVEQVEVSFRDLDAAEVAAYVATGEPMDKAGAYGIQGLGATIVRRIEGDYFAVVGLPLARLVTLLRDTGVRYQFGGLVVGGVDAEQPERRCSF